jgi:hypothetical protein
MKSLLGPAAGQTETAMVAGRKRLLDLRQPTSDPAVAKLTLKQATDLLEDGLSRLPALAKDLVSKPALELLDGRSLDDTSVFLVLDHDDLGGVSLRPNLSGAEPAQLLAAATPLGDLLEPLTLDALTVHDDHRFVELLPKQRNLPPELAAEVASLF